MSYLLEHCTLYEITEPTDLGGFECGDQDLDDFFSNLIYFLSFLNETKRMCRSLCCEYINIIVL